MAKIIIFGVNDFAELAHYYLTTDSEHEVIAFSVDKDYMPERKVFNGLPVVEFENIEEYYSVDEFLFFAPMAPSEMNRLREKIYYSIKRKGYHLINYISSRATILSKFEGDNCFVLEDNTIQPFVKLGSNLVLWSGNHIGHHSIIEDHVMFTSHVVLSGHCHVKKYAVLGVNSAIRDGVIINEGTFVGMGSSIVKNTEPWMVYVGNPAKPLKSSI